MSTHKTMRLTGDSTVQILREARETYPAILGAIQIATSSIRFANYCMEPGEAFSRFSQALAEAAGRGIQVRLMLDAYGSRGTGRERVAAMQNAGVEMVWRRQRTLGQLLRYNHGLHKKLLVIDNKIGFTGGIGVGDFWVQATPGYPAAWRDTHFRLAGPVVAAMTAAFDQSWQGEGGQPPVPGSREAEFRGDTTITPIDSAPRSYPRLTPVGEALLELIAGTKHQLTITTAYFGPSRPVIQALRQTARRGVQVRILTNGPYCTHPRARDAGRHRYAPLLGAGIHIYEYQPTKIHAKLVTSDGTTSIIGSANLNFRSLYHSLYHDEEFNLMIRSPQLAEQLDEQFERDLEKAIEIDPATWLRRPLPDKLRQATASLARYIF